MKGPTRLHCGRDAKGVFVRLGRSAEVNGTGVHKGSTRVFSQNIVLSDEQAAELGLFLIHLAGFDDHVRYESWPRPESNPTQTSSLCSCAPAAGSSCDSL